MRLARALPLAVTAVAGLAAPAASAQEPERTALALHAGWWHAEAEARASFGLFADVGAFWVPLAFGDAGATMLEVKLGYDHRASPRLRVRAGMRVVLDFGDDINSRETALANVQHLVAMLLEVGLLYEHPSGFVAGVDVPHIAGVDLGVDTLGGPLPPPWAFLFSQFYVGWRWSP